MNPTAAVHNDDGKTVYKDLRGITGKRGKGIGQAAEKPQEELSSAVIMPDTARTVFQVQKNGKWGSITPDGTEVVPLVYDSIVPYAEGYLIVQKGDGLGIIRTDWVWQ